MIRLFAILLTLVITNVALQPPRSSAAAEIPADWKIDNVRRSESARGTETVEILNLHGDLRIRPTDEDEIYLSAMIQRHADDPLRAEIATGHEDSTLHLDVSYPEIDGFVPAEQPADWRKRRVDLTVFVPAKRPLTIETDRGLLEVKGLDHGITARSAHGDIVLATGGPVTARTERGSITCRFTDSDWPRPAELETLTGSITVTLPAAADTTVIMTTLGELTTDFSLTVTRPSDSERKTARAIIGKGTVELLMTSNRGNLKLLRQP